MTKQAASNINAYLTPGVSTNQANVVSYLKDGAGEEIRTPDQRLGKPMRYHCATPAQNIIEFLL